MENNNLSLEFLTFAYLTLTDCQKKRVQISWTIANSSLNNEELSKEVCLSNCRVRKIRKYELPLKIDYQFETTIV